jgi:hypothetical protein
LSSINAQFRYGRANLASIAGFIWVWRTRLPLIKLISLHNQPIAIVPTTPTTALIASLQPNRSYAPVGEHGRCSPSSCGDGERQFIAKSLIRLQEYRGGVPGGGKSAAARDIEVSHLTRAAVLKILGRPQSAATVGMARADSAVALDSCLGVGRYTGSRTPLTSLRAACDPLVS